MRCHAIPPQGQILVTGATGGVGSLAISLLARQNYTVAASTGKPDAYNYLRQLGASEILSREKVSAESGRPLEHSDGPQASTIWAEQHWPT